MIPFNSKTFDYAKIHKNHDICKQIAKNMKKARSEMQKGESTPSLPNT
jgi:hypothetical protein